MLWMKPATLLKVTLLHGCFSRFLNCKMVPNRIRKMVRKASHMSILEREACYVHLDGVFLEEEICLGKTEGCRLLCPLTNSFNLPHRLLRKLH